MFAQRCPSCRSSRLKRGYTDPPLLFRLFGVYNLLCENCNLLFKGLAVPGTVPARGSGRRRGHSAQGKMGAKRASR
jgi:hypothetical protein